MLAAIVAEPFLGSTGDLAAMEGPERALRSLGRMRVDVLESPKRFALFGQTLRELDRIIRKAPGLANAVGRSQEPLYILVCGIAGTTKYCTFSIQAKEVHTCQELTKLGHTRICG